LRNLLKAYCTLAKAQKGNDSLNQLNKNDSQGNIIDYVNDDKQNSDLGEYFQDIYSKIPEKSLSLEQFLTPEIMNSEYVQSKNYDTNVVKVGFDCFSDLETNVKDWSTRFWHHFNPFFPICVAPPQRGAKNHGFWHLASFLGRLWHPSSFLGR